MDLLIICLASYLIGSIPFGFILTKLAGLGDIRQIGSGNIGATNVLRTGKKWLALATLLLDFAKAFAAAFIFHNSLRLSEALTNKTYPPVEVSAFNQFVYDYGIGFVLCSVILGHMFPIWLKFRGGKGVACVFGLTFALSWQAGIAIAIGWLSVFLSTRTSSLGALIGIPLGMIAAAFNDFLPLWPALVLPLALMIFQHRENIRRLWKGEEHRFAFKKDKSL